MEKRVIVTCAYKVEMDLDCTGVSDSELIATAMQDAHDIIQSELKNKEITANDFTYQFVRIERRLSL